MHDLGRQLYMEGPDLEQGCSKSIDIQGIHFSTVLHVLTHFSSLCSKCLMSFLTDTITYDIEREFLGQYVFLVILITDDQHL